MVIHKHKLEWYDCRNKKMSVDEHIFIVANN